jgi:hypothetical protein
MRRPAARAEGHRFGRYRRLSPGEADHQIKPLAIGIAAGILFDATVIRALLVPALVRLLVDANSWMPNWTSIAWRGPRRGVDGSLRSFQS